MKSKEEFEQIIENRLIETLPKTKKNRQEVAKALEKIDTSDLTALAKVGVNALIDEVTGFQDERKDGDLIKELNRNKR